MPAWAFSVVGGVPIVCSVGVACATGAGAGIRATSPTGVGMPYPA